MSVFRVVFGFVFSVMLSVNVMAVEAVVDPTRPARFSAGAGGHLENLKKQYTLNSVLISQQRRVAVINGQRVVEGDRINEAMVRRIEKSQVKLVVDGAGFMIRLSKNNIKK